MATVNLTLKPFRIFAAREDEADAGWIWWASTVPSRTVVKIENAAKHRHVYCQARQLELNYLGWYNAKTAKSSGAEFSAPAPPANREPLRYWIDPDKLDDVLVINQWYRDALGGIETTRNRPNAKVPLRITTARLAPQLWWWGVRAAIHHPDIACRVGTRLGILGIWLGIVGLFAALLPIPGPPEPGTAARLWLLGLAVATAVPAVKAAWGVSRLPRSA